MVGPLVYLFFMILGDMLKRAWYIFLAVTLFVMLLVMVFVLANSGTVVHGAVLGLGIGLVVSLVGGAIGSISVIRGPWG